MSNNIFPTLIGQDILVIRSPIHRTEVKTSLGGKEQRLTWQSGPRYRYRLQFNALRSDSTFRELQAIQRFVVQHAGQLDSFLFSDPEDNYVSGMGFGYGNGSTTGFQLQRSLVGDTTDRLGTWPLHSTPHTNLCTFSQNPANAAWSKGQNPAGIGLVPVVTDNAGIAPDGTATAARVLLNKNTGSSANDSSYLYTPPTPSAGNSYVGSMWLKSADTGSYNLRLRHGYNLQNISVTSSWARYSITRPGLVSDADVTPLSVWLRGTWGTSDLANVLVWGAQVEYGSTPTDYIYTSASAATDVPAYWPSTGDGFEPVTEPGTDLQVFVEKYPGMGRRELFPYPRNNIFLSSTNFDLNYWGGGTQLSSTLNATAAPDGTTTADKITETATTGVHRFTRAHTISSGTTYTASVYAKAAERRYFGMKSGLLGTAAYAVFDLQSGAVTEGVGNLENVGNGWFRCSQTIWSAATGTYISYWTILTGTVFTGENYPGDGTSGLYLWGAQLDVGSVPGDLIPTTSTAATRTDYTISNGLVTLAQAPASGSSLTWTGHHYKRVRFASDELDLERFLFGVSQTKKLDLITVK